MRNVPPSDYEIAKRLAEQKTGPNNNIVEIEKNHGGEGSFIINPNRPGDDVYIPKREKR